MRFVVSSSHILNRIFGSCVVKFFLSAGTATVVDVFIYFITVNYIFVNQRVSWESGSASAHNLSLCISYTCGVVVNFFLAKYAVFNESTLRGRRQFMRFSLVAFSGFFANYGLLRLFVEYFEVYPTVSRIASALSLGFAAYYIHKLFTFKISD